jgi:hypothetical protein
MQCSLTFFACPKKVTKKRPHESQPQDSALHDSLKSSRFCRALNRPALSIDLAVTTLRTCSLKKR